MSAVRRVDGAHRLDALRLYALKLSARLGGDVMADCPFCEDEGPHETNADATAPAFACRVCGLHVDLDDYIEQRVVALLTTTTTTENHQ